MEYRELGKSGLKISRVGFGGIPIQKIDKEQTKVLLRYLMEQGVNYIDTARGYTVSEEYIGYALQGIRDRFVLATKSFARTADAMEKDIQISHIYNAVEAAKNQSPIRNEYSTPIIVL